MKSSLWWTAWAAFVVAGLVNIGFDVGREVGQHDGWKLGRNHERRICDAQRGVR